MHEVHVGLDHVLLQANCIHDTESRHGDYVKLDCVTIAASQRYYGGKPKTEPMPANHSMTQTAGMAITSKKITIPAHAGKPQPQGPPDP